MQHDIGLVLMRGVEPYGQKVVSWLSQLMGIDAETLVIDHQCPRFHSGEAKAQLLESVRGKDLFIISDVTNYTCTYEMRGHINRMSPDDHYMDVKRVISACGGKCNRITVILPYLYCGRQDRRSSRESLDSAVVLRELIEAGVNGIITFDAHNPCVENALPYHGFDNLMPTYQMLKALIHDRSIDLFNAIMISPDEGAIKRNMAFAKWLNLELGLFYKVRSKDSFNGHSQITQHEYMGSDLTGKAAIVTDDVLASGDTLLSVARNLKARGARHTSLIVTFPLFMGGLEPFDAAYADGSIHRVFGTNLVYRSPELLSREWYVDVDISKYLAYIISSVHQDVSLNKLLNTELKIQTFLRDNLPGIQNS